VKPERPSRANQLTGLTCIYIIGSGRVYTKGAFWQIEKGQQHMYGRHGTATKKAIVRQLRLSRLLLEILSYQGRGGERTGRANDEVAFFVDEAPFVRETGSRSASQRLHAAAGRERIQAATCMYMSPMWLGPAGLQ
jgi:hypothetical protein